MEIKPIAHIYTDFESKFGIPRQSGRVRELFGYVVFEPEYRSDDAIRAIDEFSHLWLIFGFSGAESSSVSLTVRPPRLGGNRRIGVFASRSPFRPNSLGLSCVKLEQIEKDEKRGNILVVSGVDIMSGTPIYDIKPYVPYSDSISEARGGFAEENKQHMLCVDFPQNLLEVIPEDKRDALVGCLADDPRPSYHEDGREYAMSFSGFDVHFKVENGTLHVFALDVLKNIQ